MADVIPSAARGPNRVIPSAASGPNRVIPSAASGPNRVIPSAASDPLFAKPGAFGEMAETRWQRVIASPWRGVAIAWAGRDCFVAPQERDSSQRRRISSRVQRVDRTVSSRAQRGDRIVSSRAQRGDRTVSSRAQRVDRTVSSRAQRGIPSLLNRVLLAKWQRQDGGRISSFASLGITQYLSPSERETT